MFIYIQNIYNHYSMIDYHPKTVIKFHNMRKTEIKQDNNELQWH